MSGIRRGVGGFVGGRAPLRAAIRRAARRGDVDPVARGTATTRRHRMRQPVPTRISANAYATDLEGDRGHIPGAQAAPALPAHVSIDLLARHDSMCCRGSRAGYADQRENNSVDLGRLPAMRRIGIGAVATGQDQPVVDVGPQAREAHIRDDERPR